MTERELGRIRDLRIADLRRFDVLLLTSLIWFMVQFLRFVFPPLFNTIQSQFGVSNADTGLLFTLLMMGYAAMQFPSGYLADRLDEVRVIAAGAFVSALASLFLFLAPTFALLLAGATIVGLGTGVHKTVAINLLSVIYGDKKGLTLGAMDTIGQFGGVVAPATVTLVFAVWFDWQVIFLFAAAAMLSLSYLFYRRLPQRMPSLETTSDIRAERSDSPSVHRGSESKRCEPNSNASERPTGSSDEGADAEDPKAESYVTMFADRRFALFVVVTVLFTFSWNGISSFLPLFLVDERSFPTDAASLVYSGFFVMSVSQVVTGGLSDRIGRVPMLVTLFVVMTASLSGLLVSSSELVVIVLVLVMGLGFHGFRPVRDSYLMELIPSSIGGGTLGIVRTFMTTVGALAPAAVGYLSELTDLTTAFAGISALLFVCVLAVVWLALTVE